MVSSGRDTVSRRLRFTRSRAIEFGSLHETLLISGIATILVIRTQLWLTNYPQLGGGGLHIAHLLWGGLFMLLSIGLLLTFLGRRVRRTAAIVGGIGFGFFVDELGKFVTEDNNYFYRPAAALIYLIFVGLFLLTRALQRGALDEPDEVANAVDLLGEATRHDLDEGERREALALLERADPGDPLVEPLRSLFERLPVVPAGRARRRRSRRGHRSPARRPVRRLAGLRDVRHVAAGRLGAALDRRRDRARVLGRRRTSVAPTRATSRTASATSSS